MPTTTLRYSKLGKEDLAIGTGTFEVELSDGRKASLSEINLSSFITGTVVDEAVYFTNNNTLGQDADFTYDDGAKQLTLGNVFSTLRIGSTGTPSRAIHIAGTGDTGLRIDNAAAGAGDAILEFALHGVVDWHIAADDSDSDSLKISSGTSISSTPHLTLDRTGTRVMIGTATADSFMTVGMSIDQAAQSDHIMDFKSTGLVAHGLTDYADTETFGYIQKIHSTNGGWVIAGISEATVATRLSGVSTTEATTDGDAQSCTVEAAAYLKSGTGVTALGATGNAFGVRNNNTLVFIVNGDGDVSNSGGSTAMATYDDYNDVQLLQAVKGAMDINYQKSLGEWIHEHTAVLERGGVIRRGRDGFWISQRGWRGLVIDAIRQLSGRIEQLENRPA